MALKYEKNLADDLVGDGDYKIKGLKESEKLAPKKGHSNMMLHYLAHSSHFFSLIQEQPKKKKRKKSPSVAHKREEETEVHFLLSVCFDSDLFFLFCVKNAPHLHFVSHRCSTNARLEQRWMKELSWTRRGNWVALCVQVCRNQSLPRLRVCWTCRWMPPIWPLCNWERLPHY